jgi:hypothetical protein
MHYNVLILAYSDLTIVCYRSKTTMDGMLSIEDHDGMLSIDNNNSMLSIDNTNNNNGNKDCTRTGTLICTGTCTIIKYITPVGVIHK